MFLLRADSFPVEGGRPREHMSPLYELGAICGALRGVCQPCVGLRQRDGEGQAQMLIIWM